MQRTLTTLLASATCALLALNCSVAAAETPLATSARAILSNRCFACHGPDEESREGGLRLDDPASLIAEADSGEIPIVPGNASLSELFNRITTDDESMRMPPVDFGTPLDQSEVETLKKWIQAGAELPSHWSFTPPERPDVPVVSAQPTNPIDAFVRQQLASQDLQPAPPATRPQILRRLSLDLTGLPPTLDELDAFIRDPRPGAYERQVDRLLSSPAFGEHWARKWLDLARYADSAGYADDPPRTIWAYRDWVIRAINEGMPIDEFTRKQLAGDLLASPTQDDLIATAFHRNTMTNNEGGTNDEEFRNAAIVDRVNTTMAVWMGVTMGCAQCHTHKYDPFTHNEYFEFFAILNSTADADRRSESPLLELMTGEQLRTRDEILKQLETIKQQLATPSDKSLDEFEQWTTAVTKPSWTVLPATKFSAKSNSAADIDENGKISVHPENANLLKDSYAAELQIPSELSSLQAIQLRTLVTGKLDGRAGLASNGNFVITDLTAELIPDRNSAVQDVSFVRIQLPGKKRILSLAEVRVFSGGSNIAQNGTAKQSSTSYNGVAARAIDGNTDGNYENGSTTHTETQDEPWWELTLNKAAPVDRVLIFNRSDNSLQDRLKGATVQLLDTDRNVVGVSKPVTSPKDQNRIAFSNARPLKITQAFADYEQSDFGASKAIDGQASTGWAVGGQTERNHQLTLVFEKPYKVPAGTTLRVKIGQQSGHRNHLLGSFQLAASETKSVADWAQLSTEQRLALTTPGQSRSTVVWDSLKSHFHAHLAGSTAPVRTTRDKLQSKLDAMKPATSVPILRELPPSEHRQTFVQIRGNYKSHGDEVSPGTPAVFHSMDSTKPNRLDLANWLVDRRNPLTARVWANRVWESLFGRGIVATSEEFGAQGELPTHPALLDWLAVEFMDSGWDEKWLIREMVTSATYRQDTSAPDDNIQRDPANIWLARGPGNRLSAEMVRDQALASGNLLSRKMYGPPVRPPQPNLGLKAAFGGETDWKTSSGQDRYRRGLYTTWRRSNPYPSMATFDAPSREVCTLRRDSTNTPLQALVTLNDPAFVEAAQALARRVGELDCGCSDADTWRLRTAFRIVTSREPTPQEVEPLRDLLLLAREHFEDRVAEATQLATDPIGPLPPGASPAELASWTAVCNTLLNLDETLMKR
ncbi:MAG: hypothetical protein Aurels2KO_22720 [Aureliella sp.]